MAAEGWKVRSRRVVTPEGVRGATVVVREGRIAAVGAWGDGKESERVVDLGELVLMPGVVDLHVHANDPGRAEWEGFEHATRAAAAGGVTTFLDMPLNSVPATTDRAGLAAKRSAAAGRLSVDVGLWGGLVPANVPAGTSSEHDAELAALWHEGVFGFKAFLAPSGVEEFPAVGEEELARALPRLAALGAPLLVHAELPARLDECWGAGADAARCRSYAAYLASRPPEAEAAAIDLLARLAGEVGARVHVVHVSSAEGVAAVRRARRAGVELTAETCPHYLCGCAEEIADGATAWKCAPPVREARHREALWQGLGDGDLDLVASDHSPSPPAGKRLAEGDFARAWGGVASLQLLLPATWTEVRRRGVPIGRLAEWLCAAPARVAGLAGRKGAIAPGHDADLVAWDPDARFTVDPAKLYHRHPVTPYVGRELAGVVRRTWLRGIEVFDGHEVVGPPRGELLRRNASG
jgi:allantoinase